MKKLKAMAAMAVAASLVLGGCGAGASKDAGATGETETKGKAETTAQTKAETPAETPGDAEDAKAEDAKLVYWSLWSETETQGEVIQKIADDFMEKHPGCEVEIQWNGRDLSKTLKPALEGGEQIDIFDYPSQYSDQLKDYCLDLKDYVNKPYAALGGKTLEESVLPMLLSTPGLQTGIGDKLVAVGYQPFMTLFMYNQGIFDELSLEVPTTWEEFDAVCAKIKEAGYSPITMDSAYAHWLPGLYLSREKGQDWVTELASDTTGEMWKDEAVVKMAKAFEDFAGKGYFDANVAGNVYPAGQADVANGKAAIYYNGTWLPNEVADIAGEDFRWGAFNFPDVAEGENKFETEGVAGSGMISVNSKCENPDLAMEFVSSFFTPENDEEFVQVAGHISAIPGGTWSEDMQAVKPAFESVTSAIKPGGNIESNVDLTPVLAENFVKLVAGESSADEFVEAMVSATTK